MLLSSREYCGVFSNLIEDRGRISPTLNVNNSILPLEPWIGVCFYYSAVELNTTLQVATPFDKIPSPTIRAPMGMTRVGATLTN